MFIVQYPVDLLVSVVVVIANVVPNVANDMDLLWFPSNLHIHLHQSVDVLHPLETLFHVSFYLLELNLVYPTLAYPTYLGPLSMYIGYNVRN
jgi:hypothetical protein